MSEVPQVRSRHAPAHFLNRLTACIKVRPPVRLSSVMMVRSVTRVLTCLLTWGLTKQEKQLFSCRPGETFTAPNWMISLIYPLILRLYAAFHSRSKITMSNQVPPFCI